MHRLLATSGAELVVAYVSGGLDDNEGCAAALRAVQTSGLLKGLPTPELRGYAHDNYAEGLLGTVQDEQADLVIVLARQRSYLSELFHRSVTARLLADCPVCPVPMLVRPTALEVPLVAPTPRPQR